MSISRPRRGTEISADEINIRFSSETREKLGDLEKAVAKCDSFPEYAFERLQAMAAGKDLSLRHALSGLVETARSANEAYHSDRDSGVWHALQDVIEDLSESAHSSSDPVFTLVKAPARQKVR
jgi:hypothetical protein